jgi:TolB-like protein/Flp pilus assembly protein TadD
MSSDEPLPGRLQSFVSIRFGSLTFDARRRQLLHDNGDVLHLTPKAFDLLGVLLESSPRVVSKAELHERVWPGAFVSDATLAGLVKELRRALNDSAAGDRPLVRTSHGVGYAFSGELERVRSEGIAATRSSVAVLPFANLSADSENDYLSEGLTEELISALSNVPGLQVASRTSVFHFRRTGAHINEVARQLRVDRVLEGSVQRDGSRLRITARLVDVVDGCQLWSSRYDREIVDLFAVHDEIARAIVRALEPTLTGRPRPAGRWHSSNIEAFERYLRGRHHWHQRTPDSLQLAIAHFDAAVRLDPDYALALAGLAGSYSALAFYGYLPFEDARPAAARAARRALELAPQLAESHYAMALVAIWLSPAWTEAEQSFRRSLEIQPDFAPAHTHFAAFLSIRNRFREARAHILEAVANEPLSPAVHGTGALCMFTAGRYEDAVRFGRRALELHSDFAVGLYALGLTYCRIGQFDDACDAFERLLASSNRATYFVGWKALAHALAGRRADALALAAAVVRKPAGVYVHPLTPILLGIALGDQAATANALRAYIAKDGPGFQVGHIVPFLGSWVGDAEFRGLLQRLHLEPNRVVQ